MEREQPGRQKEIHSVELGNLRRFQVGGVWSVVSSAAERYTRARDMVWVGHLRDHGRISLVALA